MLQDTEFAVEVTRLKAQFEGADENKIEALSSLIDQAAYETIYLRRLNEQAMKTGLVKVHPEDASLQQTLPVSGAIAKHSASLTNILDKLCKHLAPNGYDDDDGLSEFE